MNLFFRTLFIAFLLIGYAAPGLLSLNHAVHHSTEKAAAASSEKQTLRDSSCSICDGLAGLVGTPATQQFFSFFLQSFSTALPISPAALGKAPVSSFSARAPPALV